MKNKKKTVSFLVAIQNIFLHVVAVVAVFNSNIVLLYTSSRSTVVQLYYIIYHLRV